MLVWAYLSDSIQAVFRLNKAHFHSSFEAQALQILFISQPYIGQMRENAMCKQ